MTEKGRIDKRRLALVLLAMAIATAVATLGLMAAARRHNEEPSRPYAKVSKMDNGKCKKTLDLEPGRKFHGFGTTFITAAGEEVYVATEPLGSDEIPRELVIERINPSYDRIECFLMIREHRVPAKSPEPERIKN